MIAFFKAIESPSTMPLVEIQDVSWGSAKLTRKDGPVKIFGPRAVQVTELTCADFAAAGSVAQRGVMAGLAPALQLSQLPGFQSISTMISLRRMNHGVKGAL